MAFINEYVSKEDIKKYGLDKLFRKYRENDLEYAATVNPTIQNPADWTIDRERESWLIYVASVTDPDFEFPSSTNEKIFILYYKGVNIVVRLLGEYITNNPQETPYKFAWKYLSMTPKTVSTCSYRELKQIVSEAVKVYKLGMKSTRTAKALIECRNF